jgi:HlyD family secretion protein
LIQSPVCLSSRCRWSRAAAALALLAVAGCKKAAPEAFRTEPVTRGGITEVVSATGGVEAIVTVSIGSQVSGTINKLYVDFNSKVKKDQLLAEIDPRLFRAALERAEAGLASAVANVEKADAALADARRQEARARTLLEAKLDSQADVDTAMANTQQAAAQLSINKAAVLQAKADRDTAAANLAYTRITSPIDGIVVSRAVDIGQTVAASFQTPTLFTIANDLTKMQILANIDEADVGKVREQMEARFTVDAWAGETFTGKIREVRQAPTTISNVVTYAAVIDAPNPYLKLRQGMTASVQITTGKRDDVLRVPNAALRFKPTAAMVASASETAPKSDTAPKHEKPAEKTLTAATPDGERGAMRNEHGAAGEHGSREHAGKPEVAAGDGAAAGTEGLRKLVRPGKIYKLVDGHPVAVQVRLGLGDTQHTELVDGLAENDLVVVGELGSAAAVSGGLMARPPPPQGGTRRGF